MKQNLALQGTRDLHEEKTGEGLGRSVAARHRVSPTAARSCPKESLVQMSRLRYQINAVPKEIRIFKPSSVSVASLERISWLERSTEKRKGR